MNRGEVRSAQNKFDVLPSSKQEPSNFLAFSDKPLISTVLGVAAGAAIAYAWTNFESLETPGEPESQSPPQIIQGNKPRSIFKGTPSEKEECKNLRTGRKKASEESNASISFQAESNLQDEMSSYSRRTVRAIEPAPSTSLSHRSGSHSSTSRRTLVGLRSTTYPMPEERYSTYNPARSHISSHVSRSSRNSRRETVGSLISPSEADFALPRSPREVLLSPSRRGSQVTISMTSPPEIVRSSRGAPPSAFTKYTTETFVFSPTGGAPEEYSLPLSRRFSEESYRPARSTRPESIALPSSVVSRRSSSSRRTGGITIPTLERFSSISRAPSISRSFTSESNWASGTRRRVELAATNISDNDSLAPSDSISQVSSKSREFRRRSESGHRFGRR